VPSIYNRQFKKEIIQLIRVEEESRTRNILILKE